MPKQLKYTIFETAWGNFGLVADGQKLVRTCLPDGDYGKVAAILLKNLPSVRFEKHLFNNLQADIKAYFDGSYVVFGKDIHIGFETVTDFQRKVLIACRAIRYGQTLSYGQLAQEADYPTAIRAVGAVLGRNPVPLIIPCHRVIYADGRAGGFSGEGGGVMKERLLGHEKAAVRSLRSG